MPPLVRCESSRFCQVPTSPTELQSRAVGKSVDARTKMTSQALQVILSSSDPDCQPSRRVYVNMRRLVALAWLCLIAAPSHAQQRPLPDMQLFIQEVRK